MASGSESTAPVLTTEGPVATVRLNRAHHLNRIEPEDLAALHAILDRVEAAPALRVLVLTGTGRAFSSGYHLGDIAARNAAGPAGDPPADAPSFEGLANRLEDLAVPTICRLNGPVYGGATDLALACDFRIGVETCEMFMPAARLGLHYYAGGLVRFVTRLGPDAAKALFLTARTLDAAQMLRIGYLTEAVPADRLDAAVAALAGTLAANAPTVTRGMKRTINEIARGTLDAAAADRRHRDSLQGPEVREGVRAFAQKRPPVFDDPAPG
ncbi:Enoyl-CoA-hydratase [Methylobacterium crusticola]|uniref:Enoyl-CoA-hydratase n=1 Tax=Methylobacterium crusticola TaxID=1697972 RepID=A0ABQ4R9V2_9HYPH|nr:enoyl-CoA hydratase/isomerase family protein [Methylobacterium crusticola]GJD53482.1 Enoyl-CoA-hydratase [Methylobacterium crusticola]